MSALRKLKRSVLNHREELRTLKFRQQLVAYRIRTDKELKAQRMAELQKSGVVPRGSKGTLKGPVKA